MELVFKAAMLVLLGFPFPIILFKALHARTTKGQDILFLVVSCLGFVCGLVAEMLDETFIENFASNWIILVLFALDILFTVLNIAVFYRNRKIDQNNGRN